MIAQANKTEANDTTKRREFMHLRNELTTRSELLSSMLNVGKDINFSCGYPESISIIDYRNIYDREGLAQRVVNILPKGSWSINPEIKENENARDTDFEKAWKELEEKFQIYSYLQRADILSGIGRFGVLLLGLSDGLELSEEVVDTGLELLYLRPFDESVVEVLKTETDVASPRFGFPTQYSIKFEATNSQNTSTATTKTVHWTRVLHLADNLETSEVYGVPRMKPVYNRLLDVRKILSGSGEMFWKGAFPGFSFEIDKTIKNPTMDTASIRTEMLNYSSGLQRYLALEGVTAKALEMQVSDPGPHLTAQLQYIALTLEIPLRIFLGSEQAKLASTTDKETWNDRLANRQTSYNGPRILRPLITMLQGYGILPKTVYKIVWADLNVPTDKDKAEVGEIETKAMAMYVSSGMDSLIGPKEFFMIVLRKTEEEAEAIEKSAVEFVREVDDG